MVRPVIWEREASACDFPEEQLQMIDVAPSLFRHSVYIDIYYDTMVGYLLYSLHMKHNRRKNAR